jgi:hypothetical protein
MSAYGETAKFPGGAPPPPPELADVVADTDEDCGPVPAELKAATENV